MAGDQTFGSEPLKAGHYEHLLEILNARNQIAREVYFEFSIQYKTLAFR